MADKKRELAAPISYLFRVISIKLKNKTDSSISELGLNGEQGRTIGFINEHEGIIQIDLAEFFHKRGASITSMLQGLEKKGYIERRIPKDNEREKRLYVMPKGKELIETFNKRFEEIEGEVTANLTEEEAETLMRLLTKINKNL
ncbi:MarR family winged helix-turn-helix transcriptional regulator [Clostridium sp. 'White wine YQ']|uniref:MarR family winged helix-turn-helix transcriptional regulator n=1 Tax=Clostridium sp. 'White wine YQ' TaxID=3027474 RepID=UPI002366A97C|nr:MarR family transcriptional regulator [Clostridium sp. 'White wine YQ']MDD7794245.1 MarR family transcriptional regulator [Clostridium sp. 'White wine YQ']